MTTRSYSDLYIADAQVNLGNMFDYAVNTCHIPIGKAAEYFVDSGVADQFGKGNPRYVAGRTGCELLWDCLWELDIEKPPYPAALYAEKTPAYWAGWAFAYYQWLRCIPFETILAAVPMERIERSYYPLHEADIRKFVEIMDEWMCEKGAHPQTKNHTHTPQAAYTR